MSSRKKMTIGDNNEASIILNKIRKEEAKSRITCDHKIMCVGINKKQNQINFLKKKKHYECA